MLDAELKNSLPVLLDQIRAGSDVLLAAPGQAGRVLLDEAAAALQGEFRTVRVSAREPALSLSGLMAQVAGAHDPAAQDDAVLELGYQILAVPDAPGSRIVWLIDGAELLQRPALRYVQHMVRSARALILVMAGSPAFSAMLDADDFASLRDRLVSAAPEPVAEMVQPPQAPVPMMVASTMLENRRVGPFLGVAGIGIAASVALGLWIGHTRWDPSPVRTASATLTPALAASQPAAPARSAAPAPAASPVVVATAPATPPAPAVTEPPPASPAPAPIEPRHDRVRMAEAPQPPGDTGHPRRTRHLDARAREAAVSGPRRVQPARLTENPPPPSERAWDGDGDEQSPDWAYAGRPVQSWQPRAYDGYAGGYGPQNSYIGTYSADRYGYRTFRYNP